MNKWGNIYVGGEDGNITTYGMYGPGSPGENIIVFIGGVVGERELS
jgi:hypothetical protein